MTSPDVLPIDPFYIPFPWVPGPRIGIVKLYNYSTPISPLDANQVLSELAMVYHTEPPDKYCGIERRTYTASSVTLVLDPDPALTWGILAKAGFVFPLFMSTYEYVGLSFEIVTLTEQSYGRVGRGIIAERVQ